MGSDTTVLQSVLEADLEREQLLAEESQLMEAIKKGEPGAEVRLSKVLQQLQEIEADKAEARHFLLPTTSSPQALFIIGYPSLGVGVTDDMLCYIYH